MSALDRYLAELARLQLPSRGAPDGTPYPHLIQGVVRGVHLGSVDVHLRGQVEESPGIRYLTSYRPGFGDVVWVLRWGTDMLVLGDSVPKPLSGGGVTIEPWHEVGTTGEPGFENSWVNFGSTNDTAAFAQQSDGWVRLKGSVKSGSVGVPLFTLPEGYRPPYLWGAAVICFGSVCYININTAGQVYAPASGNPNNVLLCLDGITFPNVDSWERDRDVQWFSLIRSLNGWKADAGSIDTFPQIYRRQDGWRYLKGNIEGGTATAATFVPFTDIMPEDSTVYGQMFATREASVGFSRIDLRGNLAQFGRIQGGSGLHVLVNMNYFCRQGENFFSVDPTYPHKSFQSWTDVTFLNGWVNLSLTSTADAWRNVQYMKDDYGIVHLRGMAMGTAKTANVVFNLPAGFRPLADQLFPTVRWDASGGVAGTLVVKPNGDVEASGAVANWHSIAASFKAEA